MKAQWSVVAVYENAQVRKMAVEFGDQLVQRFWEECRFDIGWWSFAQLRSSRAAREAAAKAAEANLILMVTRPGTKLPDHVWAWIESWLPSRSEREGALVSLQRPAIAGGAESSGTVLYLRDVAHRAGMDFLTELPHTLVHSMPESLDSFSERANQVTSVLDHFLHEPAAPHFPP